MASGTTDTTILEDSLPTIVSSARIVRENEGVMQRLSTMEKLGEGDGLSWREVSFAQLSAMDVGEQDMLANPQQLSDALFTVTPTVTAIHTVITDRVKARISKTALGKIGSLAQNAIERKKDEDGLTALDAASVSLPGAGSTLTSGHIAAAGSRVQKGAGVEPSNAPWYAVLDGFQIKDLYDETTAGVGTYNIPEGETARVYKEGWKGSINGVQVFMDNNITIDAADDAKGGVFAKEALVLVQGRNSRVVTLRNEKLGGGADELIMYDEYAYGERSSGNWLIEIYSDATTPTS